MFTLLLIWCSDVFSDTIYTAVPWTCLLRLIGVINESVSICMQERLTWTVLTWGRFDFK